MLKYSRNSFCIGVTNIKGRHEPAKGRSTQLANPSILLLM
jgi:hypothetical protein